MIENYRDGKACGHGLGRTGGGCWEVFTLIPTAFKGLGLLNVICSGNDIVSEGCDATYLLRFRHGTSWIYVSNASRGLRLGKIQIPTGQTFLALWGCSVLSPEGGDVVNISVQTAPPSRYRWLWWSTGSFSDNFAAWSVQVKLFCARCEFLLPCLFFLLWRIA